MQENVNAVSGRGVGMNVVDDVMHKLGGRVEVQTSLGSGSSFILKIPVNVAVVNGTVVRLAGGRYIIPNIHIKEFFLADKSSMVSMLGWDRAVRLRDEIIPVITVEKLFGGKTAASKPFAAGKQEVVVMELENKRLALLVDKIIGRFDVVSKPLEGAFTNVGYATRASIMGDGLVSLLLDVESIFNDFF